jgi:outer membrane lipoprotein-sorting protein
MLLGGCAAQKESIKYLNLSLPEVLDKVRERHSLIKTLKGGGSITVEAPDASNSGSFDVDLKKPDSVRVELHGPFGLHVGTLSLSRDQFIFYNRMDNTAVLGKPDGRTLRSMFHLNMEFDELLHAFTGEFPLSAASDSLERFYIKDDMYIVLYKNDHEKKEYRIDADDFIINSYRVIDSTGKTIMSASATRPAITESITMPSLLRVIFPKERRSITVAYDDIRPNEPVECSFSLPDQVERIYR